MKSSLAKIMVVVSSLIVMAILAVAGCRKTDPVVAEYSTSGRIDGTWSLVLHASGNCKSYLDGGAMRFDGTYTINKEGNKLSIRDEPDYTLRKVLRLLGRKPNLHTTAFGLVQTNGTEYLVTEQKYGAYEKTGDTNLLCDQFKRIR